MPRIIAALIIILSISIPGESVASGSEKKVLSGRSAEADLAPIDARWLQRVLSYDYKSDARSLVKEFAQAHPSETLPRDAKIDDAAYLNIITAILDEASEPEHLLFIGQDPAHTMLYVIARRGEQWRIIFEEYVDLFNEDPQLYIVNQRSRNKLFYIRMLQERGSGIWLFTYRFYRIAGGAVHRVLDIVQQSNLMLEPSDLYQHVDTIVQGAPDGIFVTYKYHFAPSIRLLIDLGISKDYSEERKVDLVDDEEYVPYEWDEASGKLVPHFHDFNKLSIPKIRCFSELGDELLFAAAFEKELREILKSGTNEQKKVAEYLLEKKPRNKSKNHRKH